MCTFSQPKLLIQYFCVYKQPALETNFKCFFLAFYEKTSIQVHRSFRAVTIYGPCSTCYVLSHFSCVQLYVTLRTVACQLPLFMGFSRKEYWSGLLCPSLGDLSDPEIEPASYVSCTGRWVLYHQRFLGSPMEHGLYVNQSSYIFVVILYKKCALLCTIFTNEESKFQQLT